MRNFRLTNNPGQRGLIEEWDNLASLREAQKSSQRDVSYHNILKPAVLDALLRVTQSERTAVVDIGCGTGDLTETLALNHAVAGVDPSPRSIAIANSFGRSFCICDTAENFALDRPEAFDVAIANMVLMDSPDLLGLMAATRRLLPRGGVFIATITHPWGWPHYCGYDDASWFRYSTELFIESPWKLSSDTVEESGLPSTHVHRPLDAYADAMSSNSFSAERIVELGMTTTGRYGNELRHAVPKFLMIQMRAI